MIIDALAEPVVKLDEISVSDGEGGFTTEYREGAPFTATISPDISITAAIAQKDSERKAYKIATPQNAKLKKGDIIKRVEDGVVFRITQSSDETAKISTIRINICKAEEWELPDE